MASVDEAVRAHAIRIGALLLVLAGNPARAALREMCSAVSALRLEGSAMEELADGVAERRKGSVRGRGDEGSDGSDAGYSSCHRGGDAVSASDTATTAAAALAV